MLAESQPSDVPGPQASPTSRTMSEAQTEDDLLDELTATESLFDDVGGPDSTIQKAPVRPTVVRRRQPATSEPAGPPLAVPSVTRATSTDSEGLSRHEQRRQERLKVRQVHRVVRRLDVWSVFKMSVVFSFCLWLVLVVAGVILWRVAASVGAIDHVEKFMAELLAERSFTIDGQQILRASAVAGLILVCAGTAFAVLLSILFNLISQVVGGVRFTVLELETATSDSRPEPPSERRRSLRRSR